MATAKKAGSTKTSKDKLIDKILSLGKGYSENDCKAMKADELKALIVELENENLQLDPEVLENGSIVIPEPLAPLASVAPIPPKAKGEKGLTKRTALFNIFDDAHKSGADLKAAAKAALPDTTDGVISSYLCYWRKNRGVVATRGFGNQGGKSKAEKVEALVIKLYGESYDVDVVAAELKAIYKGE